MASSYSPKVLQMSVKCATQKSSVCGVAHQSLNLNSLKYGKRSFYSLTSAGAESLTGSTSEGLKGKSLFANSNWKTCRVTNKAGMTSWLRSSGLLLFTNGGAGANGGDGNDTGFPNNSRRPGTGKDLGETSILRQEGHNIEEVPAAVIRSDSSEKSKKGPCRTYVDLDPTEEAAFVEGFSKFSTPQQILKLLDTIPSQEVTPFVSFSILKKLFELENNFGFRNQGRSWLNSSEGSSAETFARLAIVTRLVDTILTSDDSALLLDTLDLLRRESPPDQTHTLYDPDNHLDYRNKVLQEMLARVTEGKLELLQVCRAVVILGKMEVDNGFTFGKDFIDKFWVGILDRSDDINAENIVDILRTVKFFNKSSRLVLNLVERKMMTVWWNMRTETVAEMCSIFTSNDRPVKTLSHYSHSINSWQVSARLLSALSRCTRINIHKVTENELMKIVKAFTVLNFCDSAIEEALSKYMKAKCVRISEPQLISNIMDYARKFRLRDPNILDAAAEFVVKHRAANLTPPQLSSILRPYGELDFHPVHGTLFWQIVENYLNEKFIQFPPKEMVALLLSCVYLTKYPINFVDRTFSPYFLDRLHTSEADLANLQQDRSNLKLLDTAMTIECKNKYSGPLLPKDFSCRTIFVDGRILRITALLKETLTGMFKDSTIDTSQILPCLPLNPIFTVDALLTTPKIYAETERFNFIRNHINSYLLYTVPPASPNTYTLTTFVVNIPEHYSSNGKHLIGIQTLRIRLLKSLGFTVIPVSYQKLIDAKGDVIVLTEYLEKLIRASGVPR